MFMHIISFEVQGTNTDRLQLYLYYNLATDRAGGGGSNYIAQIKTSIDCICDTQGYQN